MKELKTILDQLIKFRDARNWKQFHTAENLAKSINIEASELLENYQWGVQNANIENIKEEVADILSYLLLFCDELDIDLIDVTNKKMILNEKKYPVDKAYNNSQKYNKLK